MFGMFGKKDNNLSAGLTDLIEDKQVLELIEKGRNLVKLGRSGEGSQFFSDAENIAIRAVRQAPRSLHAHSLLAFFYQQTQQHDREEEVLANILSSGIFPMKDAQRLVVEGELQKLRREKSALRSAPGREPEEFTKVYSCQNCGRLINYATMPCHYCRWYPEDTLSLARSIVLSNPTIKVPDLLLCAREVANGRAPSDIVINLEKNAKAYHDMPESTTGLRHMFELLRKNAAKNVRDIGMIRACPGCGENIFSSQQNECQKCGGIVDWPEAIRLLVNMDNLLWLFEQRSEVLYTKEFSEIIVLLVSMMHELLHKQETPSGARRRYALSILSRLDVIFDKNRGAGIRLSDLDNLEVVLVQDSMLKDSEGFAMVWGAEIGNYILAMKNGVAI